MNFQEITTKLKQVAVKSIVTTITKAAAVPFYMLKAFDTARHTSYVFQSQHPRFFNRANNSSGTSNSQAPTFNVTTPTMTASPSSGNED